MSSTKRRPLWRDVLGALLTGALVVLFCVLLLRQKSHVFWIDDYQISILPVFADVARSWSEGEIPLLSPYSWVCGNLAGEFQYGTFSVFVNAAVVAIWSFSLSHENQAAALSIAHLFVLAAGGYALARGRNAPASAAVMTGVVAALNGWIMGWAASDWFGALAAFAWLPWAWWALELAARRNGRRWHILLPAPFIYLLVAGGFPYTVLMLAVITAWLTVRALVQSRDWLAPVRLGIGWLLGIGLSAPAWLSLIELSRGSRRAGEIFPPRQWVVPLDALPGLIIPTWTVEWRTFEELLQPHAALELSGGLAPLVIVIASALVLRKRFFHAFGWDVALLLIVLAPSLLPGAGIFRFSFRWLPLFHLVLAVIAARAVHEWHAGCRRRAGWGLRNLGGWALGLAAVTSLAMALSGQLASPGVRKLPLLFVAVGGGWWLLEAALLHHLRIRSWLPVAVTLVSLFITFERMNTNPKVARYSFEEDLNHPAPLSTDRLYLSLYRSPPAFYRVDQTGWPFGSVLRPGSTSMFGGVQLINGYSPVSPAGIARLLDVGTHGHVNPARVEDVVLPESGPDGLLAQIGVDGIIVAWDFPLPARFSDAEWELAHSLGEGYVLHRRTQLAHARAASGAGLGDADVRLVENARHRVTAEVSSRDPALPTQLLFSRPFFPGYEATLNGKPLAVDSFRGLIPAVTIPAGQSGRLELVYRPMSLVRGGIIAVGSAVVLLLSAIALSLAHCRRPTHERPSGSDSTLPHQ